MEARFGRFQKQLWKRQLREMRRELQKAAAKGPAGDVMVSPLWLCAMANRAERKPRSNRFSTWVWQPAWMIPRLSREVSAFFFGPCTKSNGKKSMAVTQEMLTPKLMVGMPYFQKTRTDFVRVIFWYPKVLEPRKVCILFADRRQNSDALFYLSIQKGLSRRIHVDVITCQITLQIKMMNYESLCSKT